MLSKEDFGQYWSMWDDKIKAFQMVNPSVPFEMMKTIFMIESSLGRDPRVARGLADPNDVEGSKSEDGLSWGLGQMTLRTGRDYDMLVTPQKLNDPGFSIWICGKHLARLCRIFKDDEQWVVKAYNAGEGRIIVQRAHGDPGPADGYWEKYQQHKALLS